MLVLGIESSCDETAAAVIDDGRILSSTLATQHDIHERFGGVVPELASRRHLENIVPLILGALKEAGKSIKDIEGVAVTHAPGLIGSLLVGLSAAKGIAYARGIPFIGVNHLEGHLNAAKLEFGEIPLPYVGLVVSGGHTSLYLVKNLGDYKLLGATRDDAAGEAFDKVAKLLNLGYPGGPAIDKASATGNKSAFKFTRPKFTEDDTLDFSFSGVKTAVLHLVKSHSTNPPANFVNDLAASFQEFAITLLTDRLLSAASRYRAKAVALAGGVAANKRLREYLKESADKVGIRAFIPSLEYCTDNAAMIAHVGEIRLKRGERSPFNLAAIANQEIGTYCDL